MILIDPAVSSGQASTIKNPVIGWRNLITTASIAATSSAADFPASNLANPATKPPWRATSNATQFLTLTVGAGGPTINYLAIAAHNFGTIAAKVSVETSANLSTWTPINLGTVPNTFSPTDDSPIIFRFPSGNYQGVRLKIENAASAPEAGVLYVGDLLVLERSVRVDTDHTPINYGRRSTVISGMSENGNFLGRIVRAEWYESQADFSYFTNPWYRANFKPFIDASNETPFFFAWSPTDHPEDTGFVWLMEDARSPVDTVTDRFGVTIKYQGYIQP
jgi:hypothetical protein